MNTDVIEEYANVCKFEKPTDQFAFKNTKNTT